MGIPGKPRRFTLKLVQFLARGVGTSVKAVREMSTRLVSRSKGPGIRLSGFRSEDGRRVRVFIPLSELLKATSGVSLGPDAELNNIKLEVAICHPRLIRLSTQNEQFFVENIAPEKCVSVNDVCCEPFQKLEVVNGDVLLLEDLKLDVTVVKD